ncbi:hypothetical protein BHE74_00043588 [Ensete ventricosum]|nr:hypothetical protein BHE74_00043588 [Ensete ventricosum]
MASSSSAGEDATPTRILISVNESSIRGYPHPSISSRTAFDWTLQKIVRSNVAGFKLLFLHVQIPDEDGTPSPNTLALLLSSPFLLFLLLLLSLFSPLWVYDRFLVLGYGDFGSLALPISHRSHESVLWLTIFLSTMANKKGFDDMDSIYASPDDFQSMNQKEKIRGIHLLQYFVEHSHQLGVIEIG